MFTSIPSAGRYALLCIGLILFSSPVQAELGDILHTIPCAGDNTADLAWVEGTLYQVIFAPTEQRNIYQLDPQDGDILAVIPYAGTSPQGLAFDGRNLWQSDIGGRMIYKLDPITGEIRDSFTAPGPENCQTIGLGWDGVNLWNADSRDPERIWEVDTLGTVLDSILAPGDSPYGLACGAGYLWVSENNMGGTGLIYQIDPETGDIVTNFSCPGGGGSPNGIAHDGEDLWIAVNTDDTIYQVDDALSGQLVQHPPTAHLSSPLVLEAVHADPSATGLIIRFSLSAAAPVELRVFDVLGRSASSPARTERSAGRHEVRFSSEGIPSGIYCVELRAPGARAVGKVALLR
jgi:streptogramin lyase